MITTSELYLVFYAVPAILLLVFLLIFYYKKQLAVLRHQLKEEQHRRKTPVLNIIIERTQASLCLINEGDIPAKNIFIEDIQTVVDVGFQKTLIIHFTPIPMIKPNETASLDLKILEKGEPIPSGMMHRMGGVLINASFTVYVHCENMEGVPFCIKLIKSGPECKISRIVLNEEPVK